MAAHVGQPGWADVRDERGHGRDRATRAALSVPRTSDLHSGPCSRKTELPAAFGLEEVAPSSGRHGGHLFVFIDAEGRARCARPRAIRRVSTAKTERDGVRAREATDGAFRYLGVGRWLDESCAGRSPTSTTRRGARGARVERPRVRYPTARSRARSSSSMRYWRFPRRERWLEQRERATRARARCAARGGFRVDGGDGGFGERTVSLTDLAWVVVGRRTTRGSGARSRRGARQPRALPRGDAEGVDALDRHGLGDRSVAEGERPRASRDRRCGRATHRARGGRTRARCDVPRPAGRDDAGRHHRIGRRDARLEGSAQSRLRRGICADPEAARERGPSHRGRARRFGPGRETERGGAAARVAYPIVIEDAETLCASNSARRWRARAGRRARAARATRRSGCVS